MIPDAPTRVLLAVLGQRRATVRSVAATTGFSVGYTHRCLTRLRDEGLVAWDDGKDGTLRALVRVA